MFNRIAYSLMPAKPKTPVKLVPTSAVAVLAKSTSKPAKAPSTKAPKPTPHKDARQARIDEARPIAAKKAKLAIAALPKPESVGRWTASQSKNYIACPSFYPQYEDPDDDRTAADEGTFLHEKVEKESIKGLDEDQVKLVNMCLEFKKAHLAELAVKFPKNKGYVIDIVKEHRVPILGGVSNGYIDLFITVKLLSQNKVVHASVIDWKFGKVLVDEAETNAQGWNYADAVFAKLKCPVTVAFVQPKRDMLTVHHFDEKALVEVNRILTGAFLATKLPPAKRPYNLTPSSCVYCGRMASCPAYLKAVAGFTEYSNETFTKEQRAALTLLKEQTAETITDPNILSALYLIAAPMKKLHDGVRDQVTQMLLAGYDIPAAKLKERDGSAFLNCTVAEFRAAIRPPAPDPKAKKKAVPAAGLLDGIIDPDLITDEFIDGLLDVTTPKKTGDKIKETLEACGVPKKEAAAHAAELQKRLKERNMIGHGFASFYPELQS